MTCSPHVPLVPSGTERHVQGGPCLPPVSPGVEQHVQGPSGGERMKASFLDSGRRRGSHDGEVMLSDLCERWWCRK